MESLQTIFFLLFVAVLLVGVAQKFRVPYPIVLVLGGGLTGFIPGLPSINFNPNMIPVIVLPPILYYAAFGTAFREFERNWKDILSLALGLVVFTTVIIGMMFKWMFSRALLATCLCVWCDCFSSRCRFSNNDLEAFFTQPASHVSFRRGKFDQ